MGGATTLQDGWKAYAVTGRPDFLNYLRRRDVTWAELWEFYRENPADPGAMLRLSGLFHAFLSQDFDAAGCFLARDGKVYQSLHPWAAFVLDCEEFLPESKVCEGLARLLEESLISSHYFEAAFSVYLETALLRFQDRMPDPALLEANCAEEAEGESGERLRILLPVVPPCPEPEWSGWWAEATSRLLRTRHAVWNAAFEAAVGEEPEEWMDDGGEG